MSKKGKTNLAVVFLLMICIALLGVVIALLYYTTQGADASVIFKVLLYIGIVLMVLVLLTLFSYLNVSRKSGKKSKKKRASVAEDEDDDEEDEEPRAKVKKKKPVKQKPVKPAPAPKARKPEPAPAEVMPDAEAQLDNSTTYNGSTVNYMPNKEAYAKAASTGRVQSVDEKFEQIAKMGKAQFVVYMSKLFTLKGYQVNLTPVANNHGVDMTVEKMGVKTAVSCVLSNKILGEEDVRRVEQGKQFYGTSRAMVVTNQFFDRNAAAYGKSQSTSLVDRNVLAQDYM